MQINRVQNQPNFEANFARDSVTQNVLRRVRRSAMETNSHQITDSTFNILGLVRKDQTLALKISEDGKNIMARTKGFWRDLFSKNEHFEQKIQNGDISDAFVRLGAKISRLW